MSELLWIRQFLSKLTIEISLTMEMKLDNQAMIHITTNPVFHEWTKHIGVSYHLIPEKKNHFKGDLYISYKVHRS